MPLATPPRLLLHLGTLPHPTLTPTVTPDFNTKDPCHIQLSNRVIRQTQIRFARPLSTIITTVHSFHTCTIILTMLPMPVPCTHRLHDKPTCITGMCLELPASPVALPSASATESSRFVVLVPSGVSRMATRKTMAVVSTLPASVAVLASKE